VPLQSKRTVLAIRERNVVLSRSIHEVSFCRLSPCHCGPTAKPFATPGKLKSWPEAISSGQGPFSISAVGDSLPFFNGTWN
jgi:hypothetical protein